MYATGLIQLRPVGTYYACTNYTNFLELTSQVWIVNKKIKDGRNNLHIIVWFTWFQA